MAAPISLLKSFVDGQGAGASTYVTYDGDLDSNFAIIEAAHNVLVTEVKASGATNSVLIFDMLQSSSPAITAGIVGKDSFHDVSFPTADSITIPAGVALAANSRIAASETTLFVSTADTWYITLNLNGTITLETVPSVGAIDLYTIDSTTGPNAFTQASLTLLADVLPAGTDTQNQRIVVDDSQSTDVGIPPYTYDVIADRLTDMHRVMLGKTTSADADQSALGGMAFQGSEALPGFSLSNGTTFENTTGLYRAAANDIGISVQATNVVRFAETAANEPQMRVRPGTALATPPIAWRDDVDNGFGYVSANVHRAIAGGVEAFRFAVDGANGVRAAFVGDPDTGSNPGLAVIGDLDTGFLSTGANTLAAMTGGTKADEWNSAQQRNSASQGRVSVDDASVQSVASGTTLVNLAFDQENYDVGGYHDTVTNNDRLTVPTDHGGIFIASGSVEFAANATGQREVAITVNGTAVASQRVDAAGSGVTRLSVVWQGALVATDIVRLAVAQDSGGNLDVDDHHLELQHTT